MSSTGVYMLYNPIMLFKSSCVFYIFVHKFLKVLDFFIAPGWASVKYIVQVPVARCYPLCETPQTSSRPDYDHHP